ncbi:MAG: DUF4097 family beta strand repeat protein [Phycisphaerales bacterium]|nr:DUF4097 family beta strand repeat protein [Phycisphaerales bacterium]MCB9857305.1 DUF4097 family beta strand repeat protein [Phycisphaerales bacterium]MCB9862981.1 DUF4097 family beta strand repeat protein [Phycisphaerales bacterium]
MARAAFFSAVFSVVVVTIVGCDTGMPASLPAGTNLSAPDGIDPQNPNIERSTKIVDFTKVRSIRLELPVGRVSVTQSDGQTTATLRVAEIITREGFNVEQLTDLLNQTRVTAERAFVDDERLDVEATIAPELSDEDVLFDVRLVVPTGANLEVLVGNGPVEVVDLTGSVEIRTDNGAVDVKNVQGDVTAKTTQRAISIQDVAGDVSADTTEADIDLRLDPGLDGRISASTTTGQIRLMVPKTTAARVMLLSESGVVTANLNGFAVTDISTSAGFLEGVLNGGGGAIELKSLTGEISFLGM